VLNVHITAIQDGSLNTLSLSNRAAVDGFEVNRVLELRQLRLGMNIVAGHFADG